MALTVNLYCRSGSWWVSARAFSSEDQPRPSCQAGGTYLHGLNAPGNNLPIRHVPKRVDLRSQWEKGEDFISLSHWERVRVRA